MMEHCLFLSFLFQNLYGDITALPVFLPPQAAGDEVEEELGKLTYMNMTCIIIIRIDVMGGKETTEIQGCCRQLSP